MKNLKKIFCLIFAVLISATCLSGCKAPEKDKKINIVCTVFPIYDWVRNIIGENEDVSIELLVRNGTDPHSYSPTPKDIVEISSCDMLIYVGGESDTWITDALEGSVNQEMKVVRLLGTLGDRAFIEETVEGMDCGEDCHDHAHEHGHGDNAYDEHIWLSLKNAEFLCRALLDELCRLLPQNEESYRANAERYIGEINSLDKKYTETIESAPRNTLLFADRFPFRYLVEDYGIDYFAAFSGCSADSEASVETVVFLSKKMDELSLSQVIILENSDRALAETVISNSTAKSAGVIVIDSMQSITSEDIDEGTTYLSVMEKNLSALSAALA